MSAYHTIWYTNTGSIILSYQNEFPRFISEKINTVCAYHNIYITNIYKKNSKHKSLPHNFLTIKGVDYLQHKGMKLEQIS